MSSETSQSWQNDCVDSPRRTRRRHEINADKHNLMANIEINVSNYDDHVFQCTNNQRIDMVLAKDGNTQKI